MVEYASSQRNELGRRYLLFDVITLELGYTAACRSNLNTSAVPAVQANNVKVINPIRIQAGRLLSDASMNQFTISDVLTRPKVSIVNGQAAEIVSVGIQTKLGQLFWGDCPYSKHSNSKQIRKAAETAAAGLIGQTVDRWLPLAQTVESLMETTTEEREVEIGAEEVDSTGRRQLLRGFQAEKKTVIQTFQIERPLPRNIVWGIQIALLKAVCHLKKLDLPNLLTAELGDRSIPASLLLGASPEIAASSLIYRELDQIVVFIQADKAKERYGSNAQHLQRYLRQLGEWMTAMNNHQPGSPKQLVVHLNGVFGEIYGENAGRVLGAISGLESATKPHPLILIDPFSNERDPAAAAKQVETIRGYLKLRKLRSELGQSFRSIFPAGTFMPWDQINGLATLSQLEHDGLDFAFPAGLQGEDRQLVADFLQRMPIRALFLPEELETAVFWLNR